MLYNMDNTEYELWVIEFIEAQKQFDEDRAKIIADNFWDLL